MSHTVLLVDADETTTAFLADQLAADGYQAVMAAHARAVYELADALGARRHRARRPGRAPPRAGAARRRPRRRPAVRPRRARARPQPPRRRAGRAAGLRPRRRRRRRQAGRLPGAARPPRGDPAPPPGARAAARSCACATSRSTPARAWSGSAGEPVGADPARVHAARAPGGRARARLHQGRADARSCGATRDVLEHADARLPRVPVRHKLAAHGDRSWLINVWGVGYALTDAHSLDREGAA